jgi:hypothetical protein
MSPMLRTPPAFRTAVWLFCSLASAVEAATIESFETPEPTWRLVESDCGARLIAQRRVFDLAHSGSGSEMARVQGGRGSYAYLAHDVDRARVISELAPSVWVNSDRAGLQLLARVVLPRTPDPRGGAMTTLIAGTAYQDVGKWQRLSIDNAAVALERQQRVLRTQHGPHVDVREAYVDLLIINAYGGQGATTVWIDDLELAAPVETPISTTGAAARPNSFAGGVARPDSVSRPGGADAAFDGQSPGDASGGSAAPRLHGSVLVADGRPTLVRAVEHNGEPLEWLRALGFNAVWLDRPPADELLSEAARTGIWLIAPPPQMIGGRITAVHQRVLAWNAGQQLEFADSERIRQIAAEIRRDDPHAGRPIVASARSGVWQLSRLVDALLVRRHPIGTSFELAEYRAWLVERMRLARPDTPLWAAIQTEHDPQLVAQWTALGHPAAAEVPVDPRQVRLLTHAAIAAGARGIVFSSSARLDGTAAAAQLRAANLRLLNAQLALLEPWAAGGDLLGDVETSSPAMKAAVLHTERSRLLLLLPESAGQQFAPPAPDRSALSVVSGSAPSSAQAYRFSNGRLEPVRHQRVAGGLRIALEEAGSFAPLLLTQEPLVVNHFSRRMAEDGAALAQLEYEVATRWLEATQRVEADLAARGKSPSQAAASLAEAKANLARCNDVLATRDHRSALLYADRALASLARVRRGTWQQAVDSFPAPVASPYCTTFDTLPLHWALAERLASASWSGNLLPGGDMEQIEHMLRTGWRRSTRDELPERTAVELSPQSAHGGRNGLRLWAYAPEAESASAVVEAPPLWMTSAPVGVRRGQIVRLHGWVMLPQAVEGSRDGLLIYDSLGGLPLAERITQSGEWREFTLYRAAGRDGEVTLSFALSGRGEAWIDDVTIQATTPESDAGAARTGRIFPPAPLR